MSRVIPLLPPNTPRCEAGRVNKYANDTPETDFRCKLSSRYIIDGRYFCTRHAGVASLHILQGNGSADDMISRHPDIDPTVVTQQELPLEGEVQRSEES